MTSLDVDLMKELRIEFVKEVESMLEDWEQSILTLDSSAVKTDKGTSFEENIIQQLFRITHSIKGSGAAIGLLKVSAFSHAIEDCLMQLRTNTSLLSNEVAPLISGLLKSGDEFRRSLALIKLDPLRGDEDWSSPELLSFFRNWRKAEATEGPVTAAQAVLKDEVWVTPVEAQSVNPTEVISSQAVETSSSTPVVHADSQNPTQSPAPSQAKPHGVQPPAAASDTIRVDATRMDALMDLVGELVVIKSQILQEFGERSHDTSTQALLGLFDRSVRDLQDRALGMRMTSLKSLFMRVQRAIRDTAQKLGKPVKVVITGEDMELDRSMIEVLVDPLIHIARNAIDHGIEDPESRKGAGKAEGAVIHLEARQSGGRLLIEIRDDGRGIDRSRILQKAINNGLVPATHLKMTAEELPDRNVFGLLFLPGFSTAEKITDISGRGVGLDVVKTNIEKLKGTIEIQSVLGKGSVFRMSLPLSSAITDGIVVTSKGVRLVIPLECLREFVHMSGETTSWISPQQQVIRVRNEVLNLFTLDSLFGEVMQSVNALIEAKRSSKTQPSRSGVLSRDGTIVIIESMGQVYAVRIEGILGQTQVVTKALPNSFGADCGISGTAVMGDGVVALVLDPNNLPRFLSSEFRTGDDQRASA